MKKVAILTLQSGANYGGTLQCFALQEILKNKGYDVQVINFIPKESASRFLSLLLHISSCRNLFDVIMFFGRFIGIKRKITPAILNSDLVRVFDDFRAKNINLTDEVDEKTIVSLRDRFDVVYVGSDQVWASLIRSKLTYLLDWLDNDKVTKIAYAACTTSLKYPLIRRGKIKNLLNKFDTITVRDQLTQQFVYNIIKERVEIILDPTMNYDFSKHITSPILDHEYILVYVLGAEIKGGNKNALENIQSKIGKKKIVAVTIYDVEIDYADETIRTANPFEWISLINNASFVFTDSFHGVLFSMQLEKLFCAYYIEKNRASRLLDLRYRYKLDNVVIKDFKDYILH